jgi:hypothetical protein
MLLQILVMPYNLLLFQQKHTMHHVLLPIHPQMAHAIL